MKEEIEILNQLIEKVKEQAQKVEGLIEWSMQEQDEISNITATVYQCLQLQIIP